MKIEKCDYNFLMLNFAIYNFIFIRYLNKVAQRELNSYFYNKKNKNIFIFQYSYKHKF